MIGALISGGIGIGFALVQICLKRIANKKLLQVLGEGNEKYDQEVVRPVMKEIAQRIKITRFMNATTNKELMAFKSAVRSLLSALSEKGVNLNFAAMEDVQRDKMINEIGNQTYRWMKANQRGCAARCPGLHAFFKPQLRAEEFQDAVEEIADQVVLVLQKRAQGQPSLSRALSVSGNLLFKGQEHKQDMELDEIDSPSKKSVELADPTAVQLN
ncbi:MAG: dynein light chain Tctex-type family protein [Proteobacteria bacterium]|nr:dynein light chain Tctex-type family protein [Pseudomonadota bacterium]